MNEATYLKKILSHYDQKISKFVSNDLTKQDAEEQYNDAVWQISKGGPFQEIKVAELNNRINERLEAMEAFDKKTKKQKQKNNRLLEKTQEFMQSNKTKSVVEFDSGSL